MRSITGMDVRPLNRRARDLKRYDSQINNLLEVASDQQNKKGLVTDYHIVISNYEPLNSEYHSGLSRETENIIQLSYLLYTIPKKQARIQIIF